MKTEMWIMNIRAEAFALPPKKRKALSNAGLLKDAHKNLDNEAKVALYRTIPKSDIIMATKSNKVIGPLFNPTRRIWYKYHTAGKMIRHHSDWIKKYRFSFGTGKTKNKIHNRQAKLYTYI
jgi:YD repeat-containing protein